MNRLLRRPEVEKVTGLSRSRMYQLMDEGKFPRPVGIGPRAVAWTEREIDAWIEARVDEGKVRRPVPKKRDDAVA